MSRSSHDIVIDAWNEGKAKKGAKAQMSPDVFHGTNDLRRLSTDGTRLYSYDMLIGHTNNDGQKLILAPLYGKISTTTDAHIKSAMWSHPRPRRVIALPKGDGMQYMETMRYSWGSRYNESFEGNDWRFPTQDEIGKVFFLRCENKSWKTERGARAYLAKRYAERQEAYDIMPITDYWDNVTGYTIGFIFQVSGEDVPMTE